MKKLLIIYILTSISIFTNAKSEKSLIGFVFYKETPTHYREYENWNEKTYSCVVFAFKKDSVKITQFEKAIFNKESDSVSNRTNVISLNSKTYKWNINKNTLHISNAKNFETFELTNTTLIDAKTKTIFIKVEVSPDRNLYYKNWRPTNCTRTIGGGTQDFVETNLHFFKKDSVKIEIYNGEDTYSFSAHTCSSNLFSTEVCRYKIVGNQIIIASKIETIKLKYLCKEVVIDENNNYYYLIKPIEKQKEK